MGILTKDKKPDQDGNDRWYLNAEFVSAQPQIQVEESDALEEDASLDDPLPEEFGGTNTEYGGGDYPEALR